MPLLSWRMRIAPASEALLERYQGEFKPKSVDEEFLVETMAQSRWTLARARRLEAHLLDQQAGAAPVADDPDACIASQLLTKSAAGLVTVQRYATTAERSYFRARRELLQARSRELRDKANEAQIWYKTEIENLRANPSYPPPLTQNPAAETETLRSTAFIDDQLSVVQPDYANLRR